MIERDIILLAGTNAAAVAPMFLEESRFAVRVLTRDVEQAARLRELGAEVIPGEPTDRAALRAALKGCYGVFADACTCEKGKNVVHVIAGSEVEHVVIGSNDRRELSQYARTLGLDATFVDRNPAPSLISMILDLA